MVRNIDESAPSLKGEAIIEYLDLVPIFESAFPVSTINRFARPGAATDDINDLTRAGDDLVSMWKTFDSSPTVEAGISRYAAFCDLLGDPYPRPNRFGCAVGVFV